MASTWMDSRKRALDLQARDTRFVVDAKGSSAKRFSYAQPLKRNCSYYQKVTHLVSALSRPVIASTLLVCRQPGNWVRIALCHGLHRLKATTGFGSNLPNSAALSSRNLTTAFVPSENLPSTRTRRFLYAEDAWPFPFSKDIGWRKNSYIFRRQKPCVGGEPWKNRGPLEIRGHAPSGGRLRNKQNPLTRALGSSEDVTISPFREVNLPVGHYGNPSPAGKHIAMLNTMAGGARLMGRVDSHRRRPVWWEFRGSRSLMKFPVLTLPVQWLVEVD